MEYLNGRFKNAPVTRKGVNLTDNELGSLIDDGKRDLVERRKVNTKSVRINHKKASDLL